MIDPTKHSISYILDWIRESRKPAHPKAPERGGYEPTFEGMEQWIDDVMFLLGYVADKDEDRYNDFMGRCRERDPKAYNALVGRIQHTQEQQEEDVTKLVPTTTTTTTLPPPPTTTVPVPTTTVPVPTTTVPPPTTTLPPPTTTVPDDPEPDDRGRHVRTVDRPTPDRRGWTWPPPPKGPETRPHSPHAPFGPRRPADWPYGPGPSLEYGPGDTTLNLGPDDWGHPPGTPGGGVVPSDAQPRSEIAANWDEALASAQPEGAARWIPTHPLDIVSHLQNIDTVVDAVGTGLDAVSAGTSAILRPIGDFMTGIIKR